MTDGRNINRSEQKREKGMDRKTERRNGNRVGSKERKKTEEYIYGRVKTKRKRRLQN